jgi:hypothetical protein
MSEKQITQDWKPDEQKKSPVGRLNNEKQRPDQGTTVAQKEIGVIRNEAPDKGKPSEPPIERIEDEAPDRARPVKPPIGRVNNEPPGRN